MAARSTPSRITTSSASSYQQPEAEPFVGFVDTTINALRLVRAARQGVIPRITRRLNDAERRTMIKSGAVFIFDVDESGIKRWTEGLMWTPSRIVGNFLVYKEVDERGSGRAGNTPKSLALNGPLGRAGLEFDGSVSRRTSDRPEPRHHLLMKKTITVLIENSNLHLISYYTHEDVRSGALQTPAARPDIMSLELPLHIFRFNNLRNPPRIETGPDGNPKLVLDDEESEYRIPSPASEYSESRVRKSYQLPSIDQRVSVKLEPRAIEDSYARVKYEDDHDPFSASSSHRLSHQSSSWSNPPHLPLPPPLSECPDKLDVTAEPSWSSPPRPRSSSWHSVPGSAAPVPNLYVHNSHYQNYPSVARSGSSQNYHYPNSSPTHPPERLSDSANYDYRDMSSNLRLNLDSRAAVGWMLPPVVPADEPDGRWAGRPEGESMEPEPLLAGTYNTYPMAQQQWSRNQADSLTSHYLQGPISTENVQDNRTYHGASYAAGPSRHGRFQAGEEYDRC